MKLPIHSAIVVCFLAGSLSASDRPRSSYDPSPQHSPKQQDSLIDFVLKRINPSDKDYGLLIEQARQNAIEASLDMLPMISAVTLLLGSFTVIVHQNRERRHREIIAARFLAWYHNELLRARENAREAIVRNNQLKKAIDERLQAEPALKNAAVAGNGERSPIVAKPTQVVGHEVVSEINQLREKVVAKTDTEKTLKHQISQLNIRLQEEKQKNRALKGE